MPAADHHARLTRALATLPAADVASLIDGLRRVHAALRVEPPPS